jgi:hypothetical protein
MASDSTGLPPQLLDVALTMAELLNQQQIRYAFIGGLAAGYRTHPRATRDLDVLLAIPQVALPGLLEALQKRGFEFDLQKTIEEWTQHHMVVLSYQGIPVDWLKPVLPAYQHILDRASEEPWLGHRVWVASPEGLILMKLLAGRTQDWLDIENLVAASAGRLDVAWIRAEWETLADTDDPKMTRFLELLERARHPPQPQ